MNKIVLILLAIVSGTAQSEVFKCVVTEQKTIYQSTPCPAAVITEQKLDIKKPDPAKEADAEARLKAWQADQNIKAADAEAKARQAQKEQQEALDRQAAVDALNRSAQAQEDLAASVRRPFVINQPLMVNPYLGNNGPGNFSPIAPPHHGHQHASGQRRQYPSTPLPGILPD